MQRRKRKNGFSLIEMALVLIIVGIVLGVSVKFLNMLTKINQTKATRQKMETVKEALIGYLLKNGHLPYADSDSNGDGQADTDTYKGKLPYADLGLTRADASDAYGRVFDYDVAGDTTGQGKLTDTDITSQNLCHQLGAYVDGVNTSPPRITLDGGTNWTRVPFILLAPGNNKQYEGDNADANRNYEAQNPNSDDIVIWESFTYLYNKLGCGKEFYELLNNSLGNQSIWVLGGSYSTCTEIKNGENAYIQKNTRAYSDNSCSTEIFDFSDCEQADFGPGGNRNTIVEWNGMQVEDD